VNLLCRLSVLWEVCEFVPMADGSGSAAARLLGLWVRIPPGVWISVSSECCVLSARGLCVGLIPSAEESYRVYCGVGGIDVFYD